MSAERPRQPTPSLGLSIAVLSAEITPASDGTPPQAPEWIKVTPRGDQETRDGRRYRFDPERLVARFKADGIDLPADLDHAIALRAMVGERADAVGWAKELAARPDGTYARMEWLDAGRSALAARTHRFVSPTFRHTQEGEATWLHSIALVAAPAVAMPALAHAGGPVHAQATLAAVAGALGLGADADQAALLGAISRLRSGQQPSPQALEALNAAHHQLATMQAAQHEREAHDTIEQALRERRIVPAAREQFARLAATPEGLVTVKELLARMPALLPTSGLDRVSVLSVSGGQEETPEDLVRRAQVYREDQARAGNRISMSAAIRAVDRAGA